MSMVSGRVEVEGRERDFASTSYFGSLDAVRAVSVMAVLWHHTVTPHGDIPISERGFLGVDMFFALSGFLITTILLREQNASDDISLKRFYARRSLRIFPLYYAIVFGCLALAVVADSPELSAIQESSPKLILYITNWFAPASLLAISWSLATEEQFYLVWPPIQKFLGAAALIPLALFLGANQLVNFGVLFSGARQELEILQVTFTPIILGVLLAYLLHYRYRVAWSLFGHKLTAPGLVVLLLVVLNMPSSQFSLVGIHRLVIHLLMTALLGALVIAEDHALAPYLRGWLMVRIGTVSYGMYLMHMFVRHVFRETFNVAEAVPVPLALFVAVAVVTYIVSEVSFRLFESRFLKLKQPAGPGNPR